MDRPGLLVIGGSGLLGSAVMRAARDSRFSASATFHHRSPPAAADGQNWLPLDLRRAGDAASLIRRLRPTAVINAAYVQSGPDLDRVTARAPGEMAASCRDIGSRFVHLSSDVVFGGHTDRPYTETDPTDPVNEYGIAKAEAELLVSDAYGDAVIVRTSLLWGSPDVGPQGELTARPGVVFHTDEIRCPIRVDRLAAACLELAGRTDITGLLHVAGSDAVDRFTFARLLAPLVGVDPSRIEGGPAGPHPPRALDCRLDCARALSLLSTALPGVSTDVETAQGCGD